MIINIMQIVTVIVNTYIAVTEKRKEYILQLFC